MKKIIIALLLVSSLFLVIGNQVYAANEFDIAGLQSSKFEKKGDYWSIAGDYSSAVDGGMYTITVGTHLTSTYVKEGWGPELRITCKKVSGNDFSAVTGFRATVNGTVFEFKDLDYNENPYVHAGYLFGGNVYRQFIETVKDVKSASFWVDYVDTDGIQKTVSIGHVRTGELGDLVSVARYLTNANAFSVDTDPAGNDAYYGASVK